MSKQFLGRRGQMAFAGVSLWFLLALWLRGWCYSVLFILSLAFVSIVFLLMINSADIDTNFDGKPDKDQPDLFPEHQQPAPPPIPAPAAAKPVAIWQGGKRIDAGHVHEPRGNGADRPH